ncbi:addiction module antidote protein [Allostella vacuolata]|nr:addiction module antidote protein [Stella vacuolata]
MSTRNVVVTDHQDRLIDDLVRSGRYQNASEVLRAGLRLVEQEEARHAASVEALRAAGKVGVEEMERGAFVVFDDFAALEAHVAAATDPIIARRKGR